MSLILASVAVPKDGQFWDWVYFLIRQYGTILIKGCLLTLAIAVVGTLFGCILGFLCGFIQTMEVTGEYPTVKKIVIRILKLIANIYVEIFRGTPMMVQAMVMFYGLPMIGISLDAIPCGFLVVAINTGAYMAESVRGGIDSVDIGQFEAGKSIGLKHFEIMRFIVLPQAIRNIMPHIGNQLVINIKDTSVLNVISVSELFFAGKTAASVYYKYFESFFIVAVIYLIMTIIVSKLIRVIEKRMDGAENYKEVLSTETQMMEE